MSLSRFDTLIVGDDLSGILTANLLTHYGYNVVLLQNSPPVDRYGYQGYVLPVSPYILPPLEFGELMSQIKKYLSISQIELEKESERVEKFQFVTRRLRLDIHTSVEDNAEEFLCEIGRDKEKTKRDFSHFGRLLKNVITLFNRHYPYPPYSFWDKRRVDFEDMQNLLGEGSYFDRIEDEREVLSFKTMLNFIQNCSPENTTVLQQSLIGLIPVNNWILMSSIERLKSILIKRLEEKGVLILYNNNGGYHIEKRGFGHYLKNLRNNNSVRIESVVLSTEFDNLTRIIPDRLLLRLNVERQDYLLRYTTNFVVASKGIPEIAAKVIFYKDDSNVDITRNSYQITITKCMRNRALIKENAVVSVTFYIRPEDYVKKNSEALNGRAKEVLLRVFPFMEEFILNVSSVLDSEALFDVHMNEITHKDFKPSQYLMVHNDLKDGILLRDMKTGIKNFIFGSSSIFPSLGIYGDFMTSVRASEIITKNILGR